eukprot:CAMPEP_0172518838 /NCGR_PEP_ID=MMETSP1066-20121228/291045_1 /TAXON_ID=671091 /ORGANISM="Coscinodiscus wailesii, Strain CCMP2513" /LENGTH=795 /DNA_ID=CAMNT_0013301297 /DNA_START=98 /DNA_END=2485 /DNA_ORIENTATION=-
MPTAVENPLTSAPSRGVPRRRSGADKRRGRSRSPGAYLKSIVTKEKKVPTTEDTPSPPAPGGSKPLRRSRSSNDKRRGRSRSPGAYLKKKGKSLKGFFKANSEKTSARRLDASLSFKTSSKSMLPKAAPAAIEESPVVTPVAPAPAPKQERDDVVNGIEGNGVASLEGLNNVNSSKHAEEKKSEEVNDALERDDSSYSIKVDGVVSPEVAQILSSDSDAGEEKKSDDTENGRDIENVDINATTMPEKLFGELFRPDPEETMISNLVQIILLLMDPTTRRFELLQLEFDAAKAIVQDLLSQIPNSASEESLRDQKYDGICTIEGEEMTCSEKLRDFVEQNEGINSVVLAMPKGIPATRCANMGLAILADSSVAALVDPSGKMQSLVSESETTEVKHAISDVPTEVKTEEVPAEEDVSVVTTEKEDVTAEKENAATEKDATEKEDVATEKEDVATEKEDAATEKEDAATEKEDVATEKEDAATEKEIVDDTAAVEAEEVSAKKEVADVTPVIWSPEPTVVTQPASEEKSVENGKSDDMSEPSAASSHIADELISSMINIDGTKADEDMTLEDPILKEMTMEETLPKNETADVTPEPSVVTTEDGDGLATSMDGEETASNKDAVQGNTMEKRDLPALEKACAPDATTTNWEDVRMLITAIFVFFVPVIALCLSRQHSILSAPFSRGDVITPGVTRNYCGLYERAPFLKTCQTKIVNFDENGVLSLYHGDEVQWQMKGGKCNGSGKVECIVSILEDGSVLIAGKKARMEGNINEDISPWPFAEEVSVKKKKMEIKMNKR